MEIADRTPFRNESGVIDIFGRIQGTLKFGLNWYPRLQAQNIVIAVLDKVLGSNFILLRNITLPDTDIDLPMVLIGPPGLYLINVTNERGVYRARDDEWGTMAGEKFVPASINLVQRTVKLGRVLQIYLDRAGYKDVLIVDPILMAANPGMHIESVRPTARIVMSDALERFAISMNQARPIMNTKVTSEIAQVIVNGPKKQAHPATPPDAFASVPEPINKEQGSAQGIPTLVQQPGSNPAFSADTLDFSFDENKQSQNTANQPVSQNSTLRAVAFSSSSDDLERLGNSAGQQLDSGLPVQPFSENLEPARPGANSAGIGTSTKPAPKKKGLFGMTTAQLTTLGIILLIWLCAMAAFGIYIYVNR